MFFWDNFSPVLSNCFHGSSKKGWIVTLWKFSLCFLIWLFLTIVKNLRGWRTGKGTAYDYVGRNYCPIFYAVQNNMNLWPIENNVEKIQEYRL